MKTCSRCKVEKPRSEFHRWSKAKDGLNHHCKDCVSDKAKARYRRSPEWRAKLVENAIERRKKLQQYAFTYLTEHPCVDCGETDPIVLEFDHVRGEKVRAISSMLGNGGSLDRLKEEIAKCDVRCANCHARVTARRNGRYWKLAFIPVVSV
ncbi:hypothetical protein MYRNA_210 [Mycobacterium phage Myrna]|uniref:HNH endonuclease n=1 Tax=Mycobacterium phage Myrna TaxID=546805 RepID=B5LJI0_9CAUD|nr:HNH endonuclease [Mycobacterium phage Myrna]ACH62177.1 hypothetical protein MYRNA_210 [Mycobacterium phage Myrna]